MSHRVIRLFLGNLNTDQSDKHPVWLSGTNLLLANATRSSYKGHTPNMVAFSSLIQAVHKFCKIESLRPTAFYHDRQSEFGQTMREYHSLFSTQRIPETTSGFSYEMMPERTEYPDLGIFALASSQDLYGLQVVDVFLWLSQREPTAEIRFAQDRLRKFTDAFFISRNMSEFIVFSWQEEISQLNLSDEDLKRGKDTVDQMENLYKQNLENFKKKLS